MDSEGDDYLDLFFAQAPALMTVEEVAKLMRVNKTAVYDWVDKGQVPAYKVGGSWRVLRDELKNTVRRSSNKNGIDLAGGDGD
jgi:excisionase/xis, DNA-binding